MEALSDYLDTISLRVRESLKKGRFGFRGDDPVRHRDAEAKLIVPLARTRRATVTESVVRTICSR